MYGEMYVGFRIAFHALFLVQNITYSTVNVLNEGLTCVSYTVIVKKRCSNWKCHGENKKSNILAKISSKSNNLLLFYLMYEQQCNI